MKANKKIIQNLDSYIKKIFVNEIQQKRILKEIQILREMEKKYYSIEMCAYSLGLEIRVTLTQDYINKLNLEKIKLENQQFQIQILLENKFPFSFPKVSFLTTFSFPTLADGRDILEDIIEQQWSPSILLSQLIQSIPKLLVKIENSLNNVNYISSIGKFQIGEDQDLEIIEENQNIKLFQSSELLNNNQLVQEFLGLSDSYLLVFKIVDMKKKILNLVKAGYLQNLMNIRRKKDQDNTLVLCWKQFQNNLDEKSQSQQKPENSLQEIYQIEQASNFVEEVINRMKKFGVKINRQQPKNTKLIPESEVSFKTYTSFNIQQLLDQIQTMEGQITDYKAQTSQCEQLTNLYSKAIEYYSAIDNPIYQKYIEKLHELYVKDADDDQTQIKQISSNQNSQNPQDNQKEQEKGSTANKVNEVDNKQSSQQQ